ncbi:response regulator [Dyadobacter pollutisoli]|uniref:Response regulator n=1 Tax=Dyadobacter pollutisoli TaxID=2910158 RepID=A0A9E8SMX0_9BACT|nr:response regulator [Dyadobacter pollutisoli]WAC13186.1 response regulator [Dyadobacter pollutisoli]
MDLKHVLLIDDNDIDIYISKHIVNSSKMAEKITVKNSAVEALEYLSTLMENSEAFPDTIFLDISMPVMDGFGFLDQYSKFPEYMTEKPHIFMLTSSSDADDIERVSKIKFVKKYLTKPLSLTMLKSLQF